MHTQVVHRLRISHDWQIPHYKKEHNRCHAFGVISNQIHASENVRKIHHRNHVVVVADCLPHYFSNTQITYRITVRDHSVIDVKMNVVNHYDKVNSSSDSVTKYVALIAHTTHVCIKELPYS